MVRTTKSTEKPASASTPKPLAKKSSKEVAAPVSETATVEEQLMKLGLLRLPKFLLLLPRCLSSAPSFNKL